MNTMIVWLLVLNAYTGNGDYTSNVTPYAYPTSKDCERVRAGSSSRIALASRRGS